jgi:LEA14-like dessication related protein
MGHITALDNCGNAWLVAVQLTRLFSSGLMAALLLLGGCAALQPGGSDFDPPTVELMAVKPARSQGLEARFDISLRVVNPNARALDLEGVYYELWIQDKKLLTGASAEPTTIPAFGEGRVDVSGVASLFGSLALLTRLMEAKPQGGIEYELKTKLSIAGIPRAVRISQQGTFEF